ncbi:MAG: geranylgeranylglyceryl/heptaprenylglyceryl phosphate synthase [Bacteroidales bacterium]
MSVLNLIVEASAQKKKLFAVLLDPDKYPEKEIPGLLDRCEEAAVDIVMIGGSLLLHKQLDNFVRLVKESSRLPVLIFPSGPQQISYYADGILFLSLISGRNPDMLIGRHVEAAPLLKDSSLEVIPTGYMLIGTENESTVRYISDTMPIPRDKNDIAMSTALAGQMLGLKLIYLEAGSGAKFTVPEKMISKVKKNISVPLVVGGGIRDAETARALAKAGADMLVVGNILETRPDLIFELSATIHAM